MKSNAGVWIDHRRSFGLGEAIGELQKRLAKARGGPRIAAAVETTDKMTDPQIAATMRPHFADPALR